MTSIRAFALAGQRGDCGWGGWQEGCFQSAEARTFRSVTWRRRESALGTEETPAPHGLLLNEGAYAYSRVSGSIVKRTPSAGACAGVCEASAANVLIRIIASPTILDGKYVQHPLTNPPHLFRN